MAKQEEIVDMTGGLGWTGQMELLDYFSNEYDYDDTVNECLRECINQINEDDLYDYLKNRRYE